MISETLRCFPNPVKRHPTHVQDMGANVARRATRDSSGEIIVQAKMTRASRGEKGMASEQELEQVARDVNVLASFLGTRDVPSLVIKKRIMWLQTATSFVSSVMVRGLIFPPP